MRLMRTGIFLHVEKLRDDKLLGNHCRSIPSLDIGFLCGLGIVFNANGAL
jgi:hypothetical protein